MNDITKSSFFCGKCNMLGRAFKSSRLCRMFSWRFHELAFFGKPLLKVKNYSGGSLFVESVKGSFLYNLLQHIFEEEIDRDEK